MSKPLFKVGDTVELIGIYRRDKGWLDKKSGVITKYFLDENQIPLGATGHVYTVDGVGTYGQGALKLKS